MRKCAKTHNWCLVRTAAALAFLLTATPASAQEYAPALLRLPASTRALGMANVFGAGTIDSDAVFYHAAFPDRLRGAGAAVQWWGSRATLYTASAGTDWFGGGLAIGIRSLDYATDDVSAELPAGEGDLDRAGSAVVSERAATLAIARRVLGRRAGVTAHLVEQRTANERNVFPAFDVGVGLETGFLAVGLSGRNLGPGYELAGRNVELPWQVQLTVGALRPALVGPLDVQAAAAVMYEADGRVVPAGGIEVSYWPVSGRTFSLRLGARRADDGVRPWTAGGGFAGDRMILDYALVPLANDRVVHRFGVRWR